jgi:hypothetical protein
MSGLVLVKLKSDIHIFLRRIHELIEIAGSSLHIRFRATIQNVHRQQILQSQCKACRNPGCVSMKPEIEENLFKRFYIY